MNAVEVSNLTYRYGRRAVLTDLGLRRMQEGKVSLLGVDRSAMTAGTRAMIGYVAEGQKLPGWMRLAQLEAYLAPLYPTWDPTLATHLRGRLGLDGD